MGEEEAAEKKNMTIFGVGEVLGNSPTIGIRAHGLKGCLILLKNKSCQNYVLTIPLSRGGRDEATVENRVEIRRRKTPHAPARRLPTRTDARHASHASSSPG